MAQNNRIFFVCFMIVWALLIVLNFIIQPDEFSEIENRYLAKLPKLELEEVVSGEYSEKLDTYINDHFIFRPFFVGLKTEWEKLLGKKESNSIYFGKQQYLLEKYMTPDEKKIDTIVQTIQNFQTNNPEIKLTMLLAPTSVEINQDKLPKFAINASEEETIHSIYQALPEVTTIDVIPALKEENVKGKQTYFRLDHHWNTYGAFVAYQEYCNTLGIMPYQESDFEKEIVSRDFQGTNYSRSGEYLYKPDTIEKYVPKFLVEYKVSYVPLDSKDGKLVQTDSFYFEEYLHTKDKYSYFLNNNPANMIIENSKAKEDKEILVLKDSYANIFLPFLANHYSKIHILDLRYYNVSVSEYCMENHIDQILFLYNILTLDEDLGILKLR